VVAVGAAVEVAAVVAVFTVAVAAVAVTPEVGVLIMAVTPEAGVLIVAVTPEAGVLIVAVTPEARVPIVAVSPGVALIEAVPPGEVPGPVRPEAIAGTSTAPISTGTPTSTSTGTSTSAGAATTGAAAIMGQVGAALPPVSRRVLWSAPRLRVRRTTIRRPRHIRIHLAHTQITRIAGFDRCWAGRSVWPADNRNPPDRDSRDRGEE
jgi:hypothetical protein